MEKNNGKRAERRACYARLQLAARLKAEREYAEDEYSVWRGGMQPYPLLRLYIRYVRGDGHWLNCGCAIVQCSMCQHRGR
ncbi:MAG: hypothetical protein ABIY70_08010 [Capsulimonas sp.]|uniref:hypothetical protein n=1 Tax=Capsulimonas sp. TaxID=2494211 RepID=UPI0032636047